MWHYEVYTDLCVSSLPVVHLIYCHIWICCVAVVFNIRQLLYLLRAMFLNRGQLSVVVVSEIVTCTV